MQDVAVCLLPGASRLAAQVVVELLEAANGLLPEPSYRVSTATLADTRFDRPWAQFWLVGPWRTLAASEALSTLPDQLRAMASRHTLLAGLEGGVLCLAAAGLLHGRRASAADWLFKHLQQQHPQVIWVQGLWELDAAPGQPVVPSCSRPLAVPDLVLALLARVHGEPVAQQLAASFGLSSLRAHDARVLGQAAEHSAMPAKLADALALMHANLSEPLTTDDIARLVGLSRRQLERLFKQHLNALPSRHYLELRLKRSRELLQRTGQSILQVGLACGFSSGPHFSNAYKAAFGCTPRDERARELAGQRHQRAAAIGGGTLGRNALSTA